MMIFNTKIKEHCKVLYKNGDDLRMDVLIMQIISLLDFLMKELSVDLRLTIYDVLAYSKNDGVMAFVGDSMTVHDIQKKYSTIGKYFEELIEQQVNPPRKTDTHAKKALFEDGNDQTLMQRKRDEARREIIDNYIESMAGYCVLSYILGLGDRHLENVMITNKGKFWHLDFGYAMGEDPKMSAPPFKITPDMIDAFGGKESPNYLKFTNKCVAYYLYLRKSANLVINLLYLMVDSELIINPNKGIEMKASHVIDTVVNKLKVDKDDKEAEMHFKITLQSSLDSFWGKFNDWQHYMNVEYLKK